MDDFEWFKTSVEGIPADVVELARELEVKPEDVTELLLSHDKTGRDEKLFLTDEQRKCCLRCNLFLVNML